MACDLLGTGDTREHRRAIQLGLENQEPDFFQFKVTAGVASFDLPTVEPGRTVEVDAPNAAY